MIRRQQKSFAEHDAQKDRFAFLGRVMCDVAIGDAARVLYWHIDSHARVDAMCWPKQNRLAAMMGCDVRHLRRLLDKLRDRGYLRTERRPRGLVFFLGWYEIDRTPVSDHGESDRTFSAGDRTPVSHHFPLSLYETSQEKLGPCSRCEGTGYIRESPDTRKDRLDTGIRVCGCIPMTYPEAVTLARAAAKVRA